MTRNKFLGAIAGIVTVIAVIAGLFIIGGSAPAQNIQQDVSGGIAICKTDSQGYCKVTHNAGKVPARIDLTPSYYGNNTKPFFIGAVHGSYTATDFKIRALFGTNSPVANNSIEFNYTLYFDGVVPPTTTTTTSTTTGTTTTTTTPPGNTFPDASNTGAQGNLEVVNGSQVITTPGQLVENKDIRGCVEVKADGVTLRNVKISCGGTNDFYVVANFNIDNHLTIDHATIDCQNTGHTAIGDQNITLIASNVSGCENGLDVGVNFDIRDNYIHDLFQSDAAHTDGLQLNDNSSNILIQHNTIYANTNGVDGTSAIISPRVSAGVVSNVTVDNNQLAGGAYTLYCEQEGPGNNYKVTNNVFNKIFHDPKVGFFGPWTDCQDETVSGNVYNDGSPVGF